MYVFFHSQQKFSFHVSVTSERQDFNDIGFRSTMVKVPTLVFTFLSFIFLNFLRQRFFLQNLVP